MFLRSELVPAHFVHGFTTREGGVSQGRFATLNTSFGWGDEAAAVRENLARLGRAAGFDSASLVTVRQVHGATVLRASRLAALEPPYPSTEEADALYWMRGDGGLVVGVRTADCVPVLLAARDGSACAAIHSGWRGTVLDVVGATVRALTGEGVAPATLVAVIGPCISVEAFVARAPGRRPHVDLVAAVRRQLVSAGVDADAIDQVGGCTLRDVSRFFSFRRDGAGIGQHLSYIGPRP